MVGNSSCFSWQCSADFLAEYQLQRVIEHHREKDYAKVLYVELLDDSIVAANKLNSRL